MPYYRIIIWTRKRNRPFQGLRFLENYNINAVQFMVHRKAESIYHNDLVDVEVQMLAKTSGAVRKFLERKQRNNL